MLFQFGEYQLDDQRLVLAGPTGQIHVEPQVFGVLQHLIVNRDRVVPKEELLSQVWGSTFVSESALTSRIKAARRAVGDDGRGQRMIKTVHGRGYRFVADVHTGVGTGRRVLAPLRSAPIGRDADIRAMIDITRKARLVTVTGAGGVGKTTLALAVAHELRADYSDGVVFVDLAPVAPGTDLTRAVADGAGVEGEAARSVESVAGHLAGRPVLIVLDNCEHVLGECATLVDLLLSSGDEARVLATSREPLRVPGEHVWPLGPLVSAGPQLFVQRASAAEPRVRLDPSAPEVIELCDQLDNLPLALELAAGQLRRFPLDELARRLGGRLTFLSQRVVGDSQRHATMEATIEWSYRLLDPVEQALLRHLTVFPASFDLSAVEASAPRLGADPAHVLGELVDKSLVVRDPGTGRYRLLETIRVFARRLLDETGEASAALERHRQYVVQRVGVASRLDRWMSARLAASYRRDLENARQAFRLSLAQGQLDDAVEIATGAAFLWRNAVGCTEGEVWVRELLASELDPHGRLWAHLLQADVGLGRGDFREMSQAAASASRVAATREVTAACLAAHYEALPEIPDRGGHHPRLEAAMALARLSGEPRLVTLVEAFHGAAHLANENYDEGRRLVRRLDGTASADGYDRFITHWVGWMLALAERDATAAQHWMSAQLDFLDRTGIVETWLSSLSLALTRVVTGGDFLAPLSRALALADQEGYRAEADCVLVLAYSQVCADRFVAAAELMGTAIRGRFNTTAHYALYQIVLDRPVRRRLDVRDLEAAVARGRARAASAALADYGVSATPSP